MKRVCLSVACALFVSATAAPFEAHEDEQCCADAQWAGDCDDCSCCGGSGPALVAATDVVAVVLDAGVVPLVASQAPQSPEPREILHVPRRLGA